MKPRADITELLNAGYGDRTIARQLGVTLTTVTRSRTILGIPKARGGVKAAATVEDLFWRHVKPLEGGHLQWTGSFTSTGTPQLKWGGRGGTAHTAYRVAYRIRHGHDPVGYCRTTCDQPGCVAPEHVDDTATTPRGRPANASRADIVCLLPEGHSDKKIGKLLRTDPKRVSRIHAETGFVAAPVKVATFAEKWAAATEGTEDGHIRWTGRLRSGVTPSLMHQGREYSARRAAFEELRGRVPVGNVLPGCGASWCVRPEHLEDQPMREALRAQYTAIFGRAAV